MGKHVEDNSNKIGYRKGTCAVIIIFFFWEIATSFGTLLIRERSKKNSCSRAEIVRDANNKAGPSPIQRKK